MSLSRKRFFERATVQPYTELPGSYIDSSLSFLLERSGSQWKLSELPKEGHQEWMWILTCNVRCMEWALLPD